MSDKDVELEIDGKGNIRIPWKVVLIVLGLVGAALGGSERTYSNLYWTQWRGEDVKRGFSSDRGCSVSDV